MSVLLFNTLHEKCLNSASSSPLCRVHPVPLVQEAPQDPQELMALRVLLVVLETLVLLEKR